MFKTSELCYSMWVEDNKTIILQLTHKKDKEQELTYDNIKSIPPILAEEQVCFNTWFFDSSIEEQELIDELESVGIKRLKLDYKESFVWNYDND